MFTSETHEVFVFSKTNYGDKTPLENQILTNKPYMLIEKENKRVKMGVGDQSGDLQEVSYFYALNEDLSINTSKIYKVLTNWWSTEASYRNAKILGEIKSKVIFEDLTPCMDY
jgi:hypothetical protein